MDSHGKQIAAKLNECLCRSLAKASGRRVDIVRRILDGDETVDIRAVQDCFTAFGLRLHFRPLPPKPAKRRKRNGAKK